MGINIKMYKKIHKLMNIFYTGLNLKALMQIYLLKPNLLLLFLLFLLIIHNLCCGKIILLYKAMYKI